MDKKEIDRARKNKLRHKKHGHKQQVEKTVTKKSVAEFLPSNWSKYEINENSDEDLCEKANFETLLDEPLSQGSYFKFKNEQNWSNNVELHTQFSKYFTVDLKLLNQGVACVPFTKRHNYDSSILKILDEDTEKKKLKYEAFLCKKFPQKINSNKIQNSEKTQEKTCLEENQKEESMSKPVHIQQETVNDNILNLLKQNDIENPGNCLEEDLDILLNLKISGNDDCEPFVIAEDPLLATTPAVSKNVTSNTTEDLEQWLDDILDD